MNYIDKNINIANLVGMGLSKAKTPKRGNVIKSTFYLYFKV
jgi:hypothetical protein